jgi:hypothetical protein
VATFFKFRFTLAAAGTHKKLTFNVVMILCAVAIGLFIESIIMTLVNLEQKQNR